MKKIFLVVVLGFVSLFAAGCSNSYNVSSASVAKEYTKMLSEGKYSKMDSVVYHEEDALFNNDNIKSIVKDTELDLSGNQVVEVVEESEATENENGDTIVTVTLSLDDERTFEVDTIEVDGKWYVYEDMLFDEEISIIVPSGVTLEIEGTPISKDKMVKRTMDISVKHPETDNLLYFSEEDLTVNVENAEMDVYVFEKPLKGSYDIKLKGDKNLKDVIMTNSYCGDIESGNYNYKCDNGIVEYDFFSVNLMKNKKIKDFVMDYASVVFKNIEEGKSFSTISKYFTDDAMEDAKAGYDDMYNVITNASESAGISQKSYYDSIVIDKMNYIDIKTINSDNIVVVFDYALEYDFNIVHSADNIEKFDYYTEYKGVMWLTESGNTYKIKNGFGLFVQ